MFTVNTYNTIVPSQLHSEIFRVKSWVFLRPNQPPSHRSHSINHLLSHSLPIETFLDSLTILYSLYWCPFRIRFCVLLLDEYKLWNKSFGVIAKFKSSYN